MARRRMELVLAHLPWLALAAAVCVKTWAAPQVHTVYPKFAGGARQWWARESLYDDDERLGAFRYCPTFAIGMTPFASLGLRVGGMAWSLFGITIFVIALHAWIGRLGIERHAPGTSAILLLMTWLSALRGVWNGQSNIVVAAALLFAVAAIADAKWWRAAAWLGLAVVLKLSPLAVALLLAAAWPRQLAGRFIIILLAFAAAPFAFAAPTYAAAQYGEWFQHLRATSEARWPSFRDAWTVWELVQNPIHVQAYRILQAATALAVLCWSLRRIQGPAARRATAVASLGVAWMMLFGPAVEYNTYILLGPFVSLAVAESLSNRGAIKHASASTSARLSYAAMPAIAYVLTTVAGAGEVERRMMPLVPWWSVALPCGAAVFAAWAMRWGYQGLARSSRSLL